MRSIATVLFWTLVSPVLLTGQSAFGADMKVITSPAPEKATSVREPAASYPSVEDIRPGGPPITLGVSLGTLLHLPIAARTVFVANEDVADVQVKDPAFIYVTAKKPGATVLYAADDAGHILLNKVIEVINGPVAVIRGAKLDTGEPAPPPNFLVLPLQAAQAPTPAAR